MHLPIIPRLYFCAAVNYVNFTPLDLNPDPLSLTSLIKGIVLVSLISSSFLNSAHLSNTQIRSPQNILDSLGFLRFLDPTQASPLLRISSVHSFKIVTWLSFK